ncbi:MAG: ABC transporter permease [Planctomycetota bacterium]|nr:MAG: ABC transporter permease [Planctomycetota bacterium]
MTTYILRRLIEAVFVLLILTCLVFFCMRLVPGDPIFLYMDSTDVNMLTPEKIAALKHELGLDQPLIVQYGRWLANAVRGDLGMSLFYSDRVSKMIAERLPVTIHLGIFAFILSSVVGIVLGIVAAVRRGRWLDTVATLAANLFITIPMFWLGILLILALGLYAGILPISGYTSPFEDFWLSTKQLIMPVLCLAVGSMGSNARLTRTSMLEVIHQDYIRTAWSKGLKEKSIISKHALKNSLIPVVTVLGLHIRIIFGGAVLIETVFSIPGMGSLMVDATFNKDYTLVQGGVMVVAIIVILSNLIVDISYGWLDPRVRYD